MSLNPPSVTSAPVNGPPPVSGPVQQLPSEAERINFAQIVAVKFWRRWNIPHQELEDCRQEAVLAAVQAWPMFNPARGADGAKWTNFLLVCINRRLNEWNYARHLIRPCRTTLRKHHPKLLRRRALKYDPADNPTRSINGEEGESLETLCEMIRLVRKLPPGTHRAIFMQSLAGETLTAIRCRLRLKSSTVWRTWREIHTILRPILEQAA